MRGKNESAGTRAAKKIAIIGLPNSGKSQVFCNLTGEYTVVANYALTTVEMKRAACEIGGQKYEFIDTPGLHCLYIHSVEELAVRDMLLKEKPDGIIQCIDANNLKHSLVLTADLLELGIPMVISLNAIDETLKGGAWIDTPELARVLGVPVVESVATCGIGTEELKKSLSKMKAGKIDVRYGAAVEEELALIVSKLPAPIIGKNKLAVLLLLNDPFLAEHLKEVYGENAASELLAEAERFRRNFKGNIGRLINNNRNIWTNALVGKIVRKNKIAPGSFSLTFARLSRHPVFGIPILLAIIAVMYFLVVDVANVLAGWLGQHLWVPVEHMVNTFVPAGFWNEFLIGDYGILSLGLFNAILTVVPILSIFFIAFNTLEDVGYIPNLCILTKRIFEKLGLSGSAIMPLVLGFGCKTMATITTKSLRSKKERYIAIYLIAFAIPCAGQMGLNMSILGRMGGTAFAITFLFLALVEIGAGIVLNKIVKDDKKGDFLQELPAIRLPSVKAVLKKTYYRIAWFLKEALPIFMIAAVALFVSDKIGILGALKDMLSPVIKGFLGLPIEMVDALIVCVARHEAAAGMIIQLLEKGKLDYVQCIVAVAITTMLPCFSNIMAIVKELGARSAFTMTIVISTSAFALVGILNRILTCTIGRLTP